VPPTAVQSPADGQETPFSTLAKDEAGLGVDWIDHLEPLHDMASVKVPLAVV
jgi:hypothetical protein